MMNRKPIVIFGAGGHGKVITDILEKMGTWQILGFLDSSRAKGSLVMDYAVLGNEEDLLTLPQDVSCIIAIGDNWTRSQVEKKLLKIKPTLFFAIAIHPGAVIGRDVEVGVGTVVMAGAVINPCTKIGRHCKVNTGATIDHDNVLGDFSAVEPGATLSGTVSVGEFSTIAVGAKVKHGIAIGPHTVIGAGSTVLSNIADHVVAYGTPAVVVRTRKVNDRYL